MAKWRVWFSSRSIVVEADNIIDACNKAIIAISTDNFVPSYVHITKAYNLAWVNE